MIQKQKCRNNQKYLQLDDLKFVYNVKMGLMHLFRKIVINLENI